MNGHAVGIGLTLAMQCDIRLVARQAKLAFAHVRRGVLPDAHSHWTVPRTIGWARTAELFLTGRTFTGEEAAAMGLASRALPAGEVLAAATEMARDIAVNTAPLSVALSKRLLWESRSLDRSAPRAPDEQDRGDDQDRAAPEFVRERPGEERSDRTSEQKGRHVEAGAKVGGMESLVESVHGPIDHTAVETKKKTTERGYC